MPFACLTKLSSVRQECMNKSGSSCSCSSHLILRLPPLIRLIVVEYFDVSSDLLPGAVE